MTELAVLQDLVGRAGSYAVLRFATATADPERGALLQKVQERGTQLETKLLFFDLEWAALEDEHADRLLAADGLDFARHHLRTARRYRPHLLSEPEEKILAEKSLTSSAAWTRLFEEQAAAIEVELDGEDEPRRAGDRAVAPVLARARRAPPRRRARHRGTAAGTAGARVRAQHAARRQDGRGPATALPALAREPQPGQRGVGRVGRRARRRRPRPLRASAPLVPAQGAAARARPPRGLRPHGRGHRRRRLHPVGRGARPRARLLRQLLPRAGRHGARLLRRRPHRRARPPRQARRRVLQLHRAVRASLRAAQLHRAAARRPHASPTSSGTACTPRSPGRRASTTSPRR